MRLRSALSTLLLAAAVPLAAQAQYQIDWYTLDGGGGTSSGGGYSLSGTIGQPDAEVIPLCSSDGGPGCVLPSYELTGGFWAGIGNRSVSCGADLNCLFRDGFEQLP